ncbi:ABC transporter permease [Mastigocladopsis repens]|uniref:ABC transporter permease n=1 Tax=Mastigocladopsis repens TaxID=221287 RepID=UPI0002DFA84D|nr:ABC transporter permease [Mastigocladopsis repens]
MFSNIFNECWLQIELAPVILAQAIVTPEEASVLFSGPKIFVALLSGVVMAFAFQLLFTNFSVAVGISSLGTNSYHSDESESLGGTIRKVETTVGFWALVTASITLFIACFLAVKLSLIESALLGAIIGVVIWSTYFFLLVWLGSSAVGSLIGTVVSTATSGFQGLMGTATAALGASAAQKQMVSTAEEITAAVRRELTSGLDADSIRNTLQSSLASLPVPKFDLKEIRTQFDQLLKDADLQSIADSDVLKNINRQTFVDVISSRTDFSKEDINRIADELEAAWQQSLGWKNPTEQVINLLKSATSEELNSEQLGERLQELVTAGGGNGKQSNGVMKQAITYGLSAVAPAVLNRVNLSEIDFEKLTGQLQKLKNKVQDVDIEKITDQLQKLREQATESIAATPALPHNTIKADVEDYIKNSFPWHLNRITLKDEFKDVIYDPNANPTTVRRELEELNQEYFANLLTQRGDISEARVKEIGSQLESVRAEVLETVQQAEAREKTQDLRSRIENYLRSTGKEELNPEEIERDFAKLLEDPESGFEDLTERFKQFDRDTFVQLLQQREDISEEEANNIVSKLESTRDNVLNRARQLQEQARTKADQLRQRVEDYLRNTNKEELNPEGIKRDFRVLLEDPQAGMSLVRDRALRGSLWEHRLSQFDRDTLVKLLTQRQDLSEEQVNQIIDQLEAVRNSILQAPRKVADTAKEQYEQTLSAIAEYLRKTNLEELNPEGIQQDLAKLLDNPKEGALALRDRLSGVDRETLVKLLSQRGDLSEEQVNRVIDQVQEAIRSIVGAPRRLANRATKQVLDFEANLEDYLRNTNKEELNPESIKRDLQLLLSDPRAGVGSLGDRVSKFDRSTLVALLSQRQDISQEEANRIVEQIESVRSSIVEQFQQIQQRVTSVIDGIFARIRTYLNSLNRPELNYEGIQQDFAKLFDDPQVGFEALRSRLSQFDRGTLVALLSSREDISEEDANRIVNQIEAARDSVLHRAERIQQEVQKRLSAVQEQAKKQGIEAKKAVAGAAWWLFGTALTSLVASAMGGAVAVAGLNFLG